MEFSNELITVSKRYFPLRPRYSSRFVKKPARMRFGAIKSEDFVINRYPVLACIGYVIAHRKYPENTAKSLGIALANQYAAWKNTNGGFGKLKGGKESPSAEVKFEKEQKGDVVNFCGESFVMENGIVIGAYYRKIWSKAEPSQFDFKVIRAFNSIKKEGFDFICQKIRELLEKEPSSEGFSEAPFGKNFFRFWKASRDILRSREIWQG